MVALENGNVVLIGGHGHGYLVTMFDFEIEEWVNLANLTFYSDRYEPKSKKVQNFSSIEFFLWNFVEFLLIAENRLIILGELCKYGFDLSGKGGTRASPGTHFYP